MRRNSTMAAPWDTEPAEEAGSAMPGMEVRDAAAVCIDWREYAAEPVLPGTEAN